MLRRWISLENPRVSGDDEGRDGTRTFDIGRVSKLVEDDGDASTVLRREDVVEESALARPEEPSDDGERDAIGAGRELRDVVV